METTQEEKLGKLEALLFIHGEPLSFRKVAALLSLEVSEVEGLIEALKEHFQLGMHGVDLIVDNQKVQMVTKAAHAGLLEGFMKEQLSEDLTPASLEALAVISYLGPLSRARLEYIRGVNSTFTLRSLMVRGLIERIPDPARQGSYLYKPSFDLLKHLGLSSQRGLPEFEQFRSQLEKLRESSGEGENNPQSSILTSQS